MGVAQLFYYKGNYIAKIELDIIITEGAIATARVTENPVENGANINDHIIIEPMVFNVQGVVSNISSSITDFAKTVTTSFTKFSTKSMEAWEALLSLQVDRKPFTLVQGLKEYNNVIILSLSEQQDTNTANSLFFTAVMKEIIFVGSQVVTSDHFSEEDISDQMLPTTNSGLKQVTEVTE